MKLSENPYANWEGPLHADVYEANTLLAGGGRSYGRLQQEMINDLTRYFPGLSPEKILDVGCASGHSTLVLGERYPDAIIFAQDINPRALDVLRFKLGIISLDMEQHIKSDIITSEEAAAIVSFHRYIKKSSSQIYLIEGNATDIDWMIEEEFDYISSSQTIHWLYRQGGIEKVKQFFIAAHKKLKPGAPLTFNLNMAYCSPVDTNSSNRLIDNHPLRRRYIEFVQKELSRRGYSGAYINVPTEAIPEHYQDAMREAGFESIDTRDVFVSYPFSVIGHYAYNMLPSYFGLFDGIEMDPKDRKAMLQDCLWNALIEYEYDPRHRQYEHSGNVQFIAKSV